MSRRIAADFSFSSAKLPQLNSLLSLITSKNRFYQQKYAAAGYAFTPIRSFAEFVTLPFLTKSELITDQRNHPPFGLNAQLSSNRYRYVTHSTGTTGKRFFVPYSARDFTVAKKIERDWMQRIGLSRNDRLLFLLPHALYYFVVEAASQENCTVYPNLNSNYHATLQDIIQFGITVIECSPTTLFNLQEAADQAGISTQGLGIRLIILTGEIGGSQPALRRYITAKWNCIVYDAIGSSENLVFTYEKADRSRFIDDNFIFEVIDPETLRHSENGELVITNLWRRDFPLVRYRTGDKVQLKRDIHSIYLDHGIQGRIDGTIRIHGQSYFPVELESLVRSTVEVIHFEIYILKSREKERLRVFIECSPEKAQKYKTVLQSHLYQALDIHVEVICVPNNTLPRYTQKADRVHDLRATMSSLTDFDYRSPYNTYNILSGVFAKVGSVKTKISRVVEFFRRYE